MYKPLLVGYYKHTGQGGPTATEGKYMRQIKVLEMGRVAPGWFVCPPDADYPFGTIVPESDYLAEEQDWHRVASIKGHADIADYVLEYYDGTPYVSSGVQSSADVWVLCEDGEPVVQDEPNG